MTSTLNNEEIAEKKYWEGLHTISSYETDFRNYLSLNNFFGLLQEAAYQHVKSLKIGWKDLHRQDLVWILSKIKLSVYSLPKWEQDIRIRTWTTGTDGIIANRCWEVTNMNGDMTAKVISDWLIINEKTRKITRIDKNLINPYSLDKFSDEDDLNKIPKIKNYKVISKIKAKNSEIDINQHVNNTNYIKWITDAEDMSFLKSNRPADIEINYLKETLAGDEIEIRKSSDNNAGFNYSIFNGETDSARFIIKWCNDEYSL